MSIWIVNIVGLVALLFIIYWFWLSQGETKSVMANEAEIVIENGVYSPANLSFSKGQEVRLVFIRKDKSPCAEFVAFSSLGKSYQIPWNKAFRVNLGKLDSGTYKFNCQMNMYQGKVEIN